jgi:hypothetical protein
VLALAAVLDPYYKLQLVNLCYSRLYGVNNSREYCHVRDKLVYLFMKYGGSSSTSSSTKIQDMLIPKYPNHKSRLSSGLPQ